MTLGEKIIAGAVAIVSSTSLVALGAVIHAALAPKSKEKPKSWGKS